jgi:glycosyltransferase involved in cell wall biosynthesis
MKILHVTPTFLDPSSVIGGAERYVQELANAQSDLGHDVSVFSFSSGPQIRFKNSKVSYEIFQAQFYFRGDILQPWNSFVVGKLLGFDVIHVHQVLGFTSRMTVAAASALGKKVFFTDHGAFGGERAQINMTDYMGLFEAHLAQSMFAGERFLCKNTKVAIGGTGKCSSDIEGVNDREGFATLGRLYPHKGIDRAIAALPEKSRLRVMFTEADVKYLQYLKILSKDKNVEFIRNASDREIEKILKKSKALVFPSTQTDCFGKFHEAPELLGLAVLEAMQFGMPVIASNFGPLPELVKPGRNGYLFTSLNELNAAYHLIEEMGVEKYKILSESALRTSMNHSWENVAKVMLSEYEA